MITPLDASGDLNTFIVWVIALGLLTLVSIIVAVLSDKADWEDLCLTGIAVSVVSGVVFLIAGLALLMSTSSGQYERVALEGTVSSVAGDTIVVEGVSLPITVSDGSFIREGDLVAGHCHNAEGEFLKCYGLGLSGGPVD